MVIVSVLTPAGDPLVTLEAAKRQLRIDGTFEDKEIESYIEAAIDEAQEYTSRYFLKTQVRLRLDNPLSKIELPCGNVSVVDQVSYIGSDGRRYALAEDDYFVSLGEFSTLTIIKGMPIGAAEINVDYWVGRESVSDIPSIVIQAIYQKVGAYYLNREDVSIVKFNRVIASSDRLLASFRMFSWGMNQ